MFDVIVVGAGTAGMTSALYSLRAGKTVLVLESDTFGGQIAFSPRVENFPSIKQISGSEFADNLMEQISFHGAQLELEKVEKITKVDQHFVVKTEYREYEGKSIVIATGVKHKHINIDGELDLVGNGVSYCAVCDGAFYSGQEVALIGDGNTALQYSILLSNYCIKVYVCTLFDKFFGDASLVKVLQSKPNVEIIHNIGLSEFVQKNGELSALVFDKFPEKKEKFVLEVPACFIAIGQVPDNKAFADLIQLDKNGYIIAGEDCKTSCEGIFVAGDCRTKNIRQLTTASADGAIASLGACAYVDSLQVKE